MTRNKIQEQPIIAILGAGAWGSTLASIYSAFGKRVTLWDRDKDKLKKILSVQLESDRSTATLRGCDNLQQAVIDAQIIILAVTSQAIRQVAQQLAGVLSARTDTNVVIVSAAKGLELGSAKTPSMVLREYLSTYPVAALSGPNLASEIMQGKPAVSVIACANADIATTLQASLSTDNFRVYAGNDITGVELGGALKNVIAIAAGYADGMQLGANARAAIMTRGLAEMGRLSARQGAKPETLSGLSGMGDLLATCTSTLSRNYQLGLLLSKCESTGEALARMTSTVEGVTTCDAACKLAERLGVELPISRQVQMLLQGTISPQNTVANLMGRPLARE